MTSFRLQCQEVYKKAYEEYKKTGFENAKDEAHDLIGKKIEEVGAQNDLAGQHFGRPCRS